MPAFQWEQHLKQAAIYFFLPPFSTEDRAAQSLLNKLIRSNLVDTTNQVEVLQRDPTSPLYSVKSFEELRL